MVSSTGVVIYEHRCSRSGNHIAFYTDVNHDCEREQTRDHCKKTNSPDCCGKTEKPFDVPGCKEECCITDVSLVQIDSEYSFVELSFQFEKNQFNQSNFRKLFSDLKEGSSESNRYPPDHKTSPSQKRALTQVYLI